MILLITVQRNHIFILFFIFPLMFVQWKYDSVV